MSVGTARQGSALDLDTGAPEGEGVREVVGDKASHSNQVMVDLEAIEMFAVTSRNRIADDATGRTTRRPAPCPDWPVTSYRPAEHSRGTTEACFGLSGSERIGSTQSSAGVKLVIVKRY